MNNSVKEVPTVDQWLESAVSETSKMDLMDALDGAHQLVRHHEDRYVALLEHRTAVGLKVEYPIDQCNTGLGVITGERGEGDYLTVRDQDDGSIWNGPEYLVRYLHDDIENKPDSQE